MTFITNNEVKSVKNLPDCEITCAYDEGLSEVTIPALLIACTP